MGSQEANMPDEELAPINQDWEKSDKAIAKMLAAVKAAKNATTTRELAKARVRIHEPAIAAMLSDGVSQATVLECLVNAMPTIPKKDIQAALETIRYRLIREKRKSEKNTEAPATTKTAPIPLPGARTEKAIDQPIQKTVEPPRPAQRAQPSPVSTVATADESDRMPGESDEDYQLRKSLEPKPDRRKFIGEGD